MLISIKFLSEFTAQLYSPDMGKMKCPNKQDMISTLQCHSIWASVNGQRVELFKRVI